MINLKALIVGFFTAVTVIILLYIKIKGILNKKRKIREKKENSKRKFKKQG